MSLARRFQQCMTTLHRRGAKPTTIKLVDAINEKYNKTSKLDPDGQVSVQGTKYRLRDLHFVHFTSKNGTRQLLFSAKVGTGASDLVLIRRPPPLFAKGMRIRFARLSDLQGMCKGVAPNWRDSGVIDKIEDNRLFIERM